MSTFTQLISPVLIGRSRSQLRSPQLRSDWHNVGAMDQPVWRPPPRTGHRRLSLPGLPPEKPRRRVERVESGPCSQAQATVPAAGYSRKPHSTSSTRPFLPPIAEAMPFFVVFFCPPRIEDHVLSALLLAPPLTEAP